MTKWEYLRIKQPTDQQLTQIGADGWELVSVVSAWTNLKQRLGGSQMFDVVYVFKRPKA